MVVKERLDFRVPSNGEVGLLNLFVVTGRVCKS